jgi:hypothetical protein
MEYSQIREETENQIKLWLSLQQPRQYVELSSKAVGLLAILIENIKDDPSENWRTDNFNSDAAQALAISLIPNALNEVFYIRTIRRLGLRNEVKISSWEILHSMSTILSRWCFIPKNI